MNDKVILTYGSSPTSKKFSRVLHVKGIDGPDSVIVINPLINRSDDGTDYEYAEGFKRKIEINLGVIQDRADQLWLWNFFWAKNTKKVSYCGENVSYLVSGVDIVTDEITIVGNPYVDTDRVIIESTGAVPAGLSETVVYFVVNKSGDTMKLSLTSGGAAVNITDEGTGFITVTEVAEVDLAVVVENFEEFLLNWAENIKTAKEIVLRLIEKNPRTTNPTAWS